MLSDEQIRQAKILLNFECLFKVKEINADFYKRK